METGPPVKFDDTAVAFSYKSDSELRKANFIFNIVNHPLISKMATGCVKLGLALRLPIKGLIRSTVFDHFCGGETIEKAGKTIRHLAKYNVKTILDYSVEGEKSDEGFEASMAEILQTFEQARASSDIPFCVFKMTGLGDVALLEKVKPGKPLSAEDSKAFGRVKERVERICRKAHELGIPVLIDAEETWIQDPIDSLANEMMSKFNRERAIVYNTFQMYRSDMLANLQKSMTSAVSGNYFLGAKLVRGAYMEKERERAAELGYADPIQPTKEATDEAFDKALAFCIENRQLISLVCGSHNEHSNEYLTDLMEKSGMKPDDDRVLFSQLLGMSDNISFNLAKAGYRVAKYVPYGPVEAVMPYLLRRAEENTSVAGQSSRELSLIRKERTRRKGLNQ